LILARHEAKSVPEIFGFIPAMLCDALADVVTFPNIDTLSIGFFRIVTNKKIHAGSGYLGSLQHFG